MAEKRALYHCRQCGHDFDRVMDQEGPEPQCPRCQSADIEKSPYLFGTAESAELTPEDYFDIALAPCCTPNWLGWKHHFYGLDNWDFVLPEKEDKEK